MLPAILTTEFKSYINQVVSSVPSLIRIENAQLIDRRSLAFFVNLFAEHETLLGVFEVTTEGDQSETETFADTLARTFRRRSVDVASLVLSKISLDEIVSSLKSKPDELLQVLARTYNKPNGNLHPLTLLTVENVPEKSINELQHLSYDNITATFISGLSREERALLIAVAVHGGAVNAEVLRALFATKNAQKQFVFEAFDIDRALRILAERQFLLIQSAAVRTRHDSVISAIDSVNSIQAMRTAIKSGWREFYRQLYVAGGDFYVSRADALDWMTYFSGRLEDTTRLLWCLEEAGRQSIRSIAPRRLIEYLSEVRQKLVDLGGRSEPVVLDNLMRQQAILLYEAGWYEDAQLCVAVLGGQ